jgi:hypothetical protein
LLRNCFWFCNGICYVWNKETKWFVRMIVDEQRPKTRRRRMVLEIVYKETNQCIGLC